MNYGDTFPTLKHMDYRSWMSIEYGGHPPRCRPSLRRLGPNAMGDSMNPVAARLSS